MFLLTTQALSFGIAGLFHKFLVEPEACVWPGVLPTCSMLYTMHQRNKQNEETNGWKISRMKSTNEAVRPMSPMVGTVGIDQHGVKVAAHRSCTTAADFFASESN